MTKPRNTGLGQSLLLQPTEPAPQRPKPVVKRPSLAARPRPTPPERPRASEAPVQLSLRMHRSVYLDPEVDRRLSAVAGIEQQSRSRIINDLLSQHLPRYSVRRLSRGPADEGSESEKL